MSAPSQRSKKSHSKPSKSRPTSSSAISQPVVEDAWTSSNLAAFSQDTQQFASVSLAVDRHRLRVYNVSTSQVSYEDTIDRARVTSLTWVASNLSIGAAKRKESATSKKRKTQEPFDTPDELDFRPRSQVEDYVALGLEDGSIMLHSVVHGRVVRTLSHLSSKGSVVAVSQGARKDVNTLWSSGSDSRLRLWDASSGVLLTTVEVAGKPVYTSLSSQPLAEDGRILAGSTKIDLYSTSTEVESSSEFDTIAAKLSCTFNGHASSVRSLRWLPASEPPYRFVSAAEDDHIVYVWEVPETGSSKGRVIASYPLDATALQVEVSQQTDQPLLMTLSSSGQVSLSPLPRELVSMGLKTSSKQRVPTLRPNTLINISSKSTTSKVFVTAVAFLPFNRQSLLLAVTDGGAKVAFETVTFLSETGNFVSEIAVKPSFTTLSGVNASGGDVNSRRYNESASLAVTSGSEIPHDPSLDAAAENTIVGALDTDLAELSLGDRLTARSGAARKGGDGSGSDAEEEQQASGSRKRKPRAAATAIPSHSLTRTLIQALHAGDNSLLEACLTHSDEALIKNTVARLPPQLAVPLLTACVERLGRGARGNGIKGRGGGASAQRGMALIKWVRAVLTIHSTHLMTMPDLVARLSHLYSTLTTRLTLQDRLLSLSGKLDLVLAQAELRSSRAPAPLSTKSNKRKGKKSKVEERQPTKYVEGESSEEEEDGNEQVQIEMDEDESEGSVEDIELGGSGDDDDEDEDEDSEEESNDEGNLMNGFIDNEAEDDYDEDESEDESE